VTAAALEPTHVLFISRDDFLEIYQNHDYLRRMMVVRTEVARRQDLPEFHWLREGEWVIFSVKRHWAQLLRKVAPPLVFFILLVVVFVLLLTSTSSFGPIGAMFLAIPLIALLILVGWNYFNWRDDYFVLTTQRVVHTERVWPFRESFEESSLENIQDIYEVRSSFVANVLDFGNLVLQTAGETVEIDMDYVGRPKYLSDLISREMERSQARDVLRSRGAIRDDLAQRLNIEAKPTEEIEPLPSAQPRPAVTQVLFGWIRDYFFPASWSVSADGDTILWRRFWLPGIGHYARILLPMTILAIGGGYFLVRNWGPAIVWLLIAWLFVESILFAMLLWFIEDWRNDYFQLTPNRMILVQRKPLLLQESRREAPLDRIQNISFEVPGVLGRLFKYGHVTLETAGTMGKFEMKALRYPQEVQAEISKRQREYSQRQKEAEAQRRREEMLSWFATYDTLHKESGHTAPPDKT